jgi:hypothetical protein
MPPRLIHSDNGYNFVEFRNRVFAVPQSLGPINLEQEDVTAHPDVVVADDLDEARDQLIWRNITTARKLSITPMLETPVHVRFYGRNHPAYAPIFSGQYESLEIVTQPAETRCDSPSLRRLDNALSRFRQKMQQARIASTDIESFIESRDYLSQLTLMQSPGVHFFQGTPLTLGLHPWVAQLEKPTTLFFPYVTSTDSFSFDRERMPIYRIIRQLLLSGECLGIITNLKATKEALPILFRSESLREKLFHLPFCLEAPEKRPKRRGRFLFTTSWHQHERSFYSRGGVDAVMIFSELAKHYPDIELILRAKVPEDLDPAVRSRLNAPNVSIIDSVLDETSMQELFRSSSFFLLPAASLHSMSTLEAMAHGCVCILADSWGSDEYLHHGRIYRGAICRAGTTGPRICRAGCLYN